MLSVRGGIHEVDQTPTHQLDTPLQQGNPQLLDIQHLPGAEKHQHLLLDTVPWRCHLKCRPVLDTWAVLHHHTLGKKAAQFPNFPKMKEEDVVAAAVEG